MLVLKSKNIVCILRKCCCVIPGKGPLTYFTGCEDVDGVACLCVLPLSTVAGIIASATEATSHRTTLCFSALGV